MLRRAVLTVVPLVLVAAMGLTAQTAVAAPAPPSHMAALGDSITRAFDVNGSYFLKDAPAESWATGSDPTIESELSRLQALSGSVTGENDAVTGAKMIALKDQMATAVAHGSDYITVLMGANDVCTKTVAGMTPTDTFRGYFVEALAIARAASTPERPIVVSVSSIPNVNLLYTLFSKSSSAKFAWSLYGVCQSLLSSRATAGDRDAVAKQVVADNKALQSACEVDYKDVCKWDQLAVYNVPFTTKDISTVDYFHPSIAGQKKLASFAWGASPYGP